MADQPVIENLQTLGMSGYEAKAYVVLVAAGQPLNGYEVAKPSGVPRSTVYETLAKLVARGAAYEVRTGDGTIEQLPLPPASLVSRLRLDFDSSLESLEDSLARMAVMPETHLIDNPVGGHHRRGGRRRHRRPAGAVPVRLAGGPLPAQAVGAQGGPGRRGCVGDELR
ncbi:MAG: helix-turn-helix domain-containing protein [Actinomycetota bacterium]